MLNKNRLMQLRSNPVNINFKDSLSELNSDTKIVYITLQQFEKFNIYTLAELEEILFMKPDDILQHIEILHERNIINKNDLKLNYNVGVINN